MCCAGWIREGSRQQQLVLTLILPQVNFFNSLEAFSIAFKSNV